MHGKKRIPQIAILSILLVTALGGAGSRAGEIWPGDQFPRELAPPAYLARCKDFIDETVGGKPLIPGNSDSVELTDQIEILKHGKVIYEWADTPAYSLSSRHYLWSASKTVTSTLMAAAIQAGAKTPAGNPLTLETPLSEFFPYSEHASAGPAPYPAADTGPNDSELYAKIRLKHLFMMASGMKWDESYEGDPVTSSFMPMLYGIGRADMAAFSLRAPMEAEPGMLFNYSGGNSMLMMAMLRRIFPGDPSAFADRLLFGPLGMRSAFYERDASGTPIGCSYSYMTPEDMLKLGYLFLHDGIWNGRRILPEGWVTRARTLSDALTAPGNSTTYDELKSEGVWSDGSFWLNQAVHGKWIDAQGNRESVWGPEMKKSPGDLYFAAGHYGQLLLIVPSEDLVIARTAHDSEYWNNDVTPIINKIDPLVSGAIACFKDWGAR